MLIFLVGFEGFFWFGMVNGRDTKAQLNDAKMMKK